MKTIVLSPIMTQFRTHEPAGKLFNKIIHADLTQLQFVTRTKEGWSLQFLNECVLQVTGTDDGPNLEPPGNSKPIVLHIYDSGRLEIAK